MPFRLPRRLPSHLGPWHCDLVASPARLRSDRPQRMVLALLKYPKLAFLPNGEVQGRVGDPRLEPVLLQARVPRDLGEGRWQERLEPET